MGAQIEGAGSSTIRIRGVNKLGGATHRIIPDRIEAGTFLVAGAITGGSLTIEDCEPAHLDAVVSKLQESGAEVSSPGTGQLNVRTPKQLSGVDIVTQEYPGFPTDMQAQFMALMTQAQGASNIMETIFENRFMHAPELKRMGANIRVEGRKALVRGKTPLSGASVLASDLRASASLVLAALVAGGETLIDRVYHIDRGYERIEEKLTEVGAKIRRVSP
jgi:UDP-N-acetylglucosamine 1-carboxyvinyltransferase